MSSLFDSEVYGERRRIPWADIAVEDLMRDLTQHMAEVTLVVLPRPSVASRLWWTLRWTGDDEQPYCSQAQTLQLCLWRAAVREMKTRRAVKLNLPKVRVASVAEILRPPVRASTIDSTLAIWPHP